MLPGNWRRRTSNGTPGPTCMTPQQMGNYLNDLRENRIPRPNGSRPLPPTSIHRHPTLRGTSNFFTADLSTSSRVSSTYYDSVGSRRSFRVSSAMSRRTISGMSVASAGSATSGSEPIRYTEDRSREVERQEAHAVRVALENLDFQKGRRVIEAQITESDSESMLHHHDGDDGNSSERMTRSVLPCDGHLRTYEEQRAKDQGTGHDGSNEPTKHLTADTSHIAFLDYAGKTAATDRVDPPCTEKKDEMVERYHGLNVQKQRPIAGARLPNFALFSGSGRRKSSGTRRVSSGQRKTLFTNPDDKIYEDPVPQSVVLPIHEVAQQEEVHQAQLPSHPAATSLSDRIATQQRSRQQHELPIHMRRNPFARVKSLRNSLPLDSSLRQKGLAFEMVEPKRTSLQPTPPPSAENTNPSVSAGANTIESRHALEISQDYNPTVMPNRVHHDDDNSLSALGGTPGSTSATPTARWSILPEPTNSTADLVPRPLRPSRSRSLLHESKVYQPDIVPPVPSIALPGELATSGPRTTAAPDLKPRSSKRTRNAELDNTAERWIPQINVVPDLPFITVDESPVSSDDISITKFPLPPSITVHEPPVSTERFVNNPVPSFSFDLIDSDSATKQVKIKSTIEVKLEPRPVAARRSECSTNRNSELCDYCALSISGRVLTAASARFHPECFVCYHCQTALECVAFYSEPEAHRTNRIERFRQHVYGDDGIDGPGHMDADRLDADGDESLRFYCHLDFHELFSPRCKSCKTPIEGEVIVACGSEWHQGHFFCAQCGDPFDAETPFVEKDGYAWCLNCHLNRFSPKCKKCRKPIIDNDGVAALDAEWHSACFCCCECNGHLDNGLYFLKDEGKTPVCFKCESRTLKAWI